MSPTFSTDVADEWPKRGSTGYCDCPGCGYKGALAVTNSDGRMLYHCHAGCPQENLWRIVRADFVATERVRRDKIRRRSGAGEQFVRSLWEQAQPPFGTLVASYLESRGITGAIPSSLRFLPRHEHKPSKTAWPIMLAAVTDATGKLQAVHRTYLADDGSDKAPVQPQKMTIGPVGGFACHLATPDEEIVVSEGIETGLSVQAVTGIPTWAALSAGGMRNLILPPLPQAAFVTIAADADRPGMQAAQGAAERWRADGREVRIIIPSRPGTDFNDMLMAAKP